ncbi:MAG: Do family serine endopeptidase [Hyphomicrobiaceae bacterium]
MADKRILGLRRLVAGAVVAIMMAVVLLVVGWAQNTALAHKRIVPESRLAMQQSFSPVVKQTAPAVVNVYVRRRAREFRSPLFNDPFFRRFFDRRSFGIPRGRAQNSLGSGVIVSEAGVIVTNNHVIKGAGEADIKVVLSDQREFDAKILLKDEKSDLAVLHIQSGDEQFPYLEFEDSDTLEVGDLVLAIGNPFGVGQTVTSGIVSALARTNVGRSEAQLFIQTDAAINPGNSGGALVDMHGRLIGVNTAIFSRSGGSNGIGFAIPANLVRLVVDSARLGDRVRRPWLGAKLVKLTRDMSDALGLDRVSGALVNDVYRDSPAEEAGLKRGDVVQSVDGRQISDPRSLNYRLATRGVGETVELGIVRDGRERTLQLALREAESRGLDNAYTLEGPHPLDGVDVADLTPELAREFNARDDTGVVILRVDRGGRAAGFGFQPGDVLVSINRRRVQHTSELLPIVHQQPPVWRVAVRRNGRLRRLVVRRSQL